MPTPEEIAAAERLVLICMGVDVKEVARGSARGVCADCRTEVWVSPSGIKLMRQYPRMVPLCPRCGEKVVQVDATAIPPNDDQIAEAVNYILENPADGQAVYALLRMIQMRNMNPEEFADHLKQRLAEQRAKQDS